MDLLQVSLAEKTGEGKKRERLVILGMLINIHKLFGLASMFKITGVVSCVLGILPLMKSAQRLKTLIPHEKNYSAKWPRRRELPEKLSAFYHRAVVRGYLLCVRICTVFSARET